MRELVYLTAAAPGTGDSMVSLMRAAAAPDADAAKEGVSFRDDGLAFLADRRLARALAPGALQASSLRRRHPCPGKLPAAPGRLMAPP